MQTTIIIHPAGDNDPNVTAPHPFGALNFQKSAAKMPSTTGKKNSASVTLNPIFPHEAAAGAAVKSLNAAKSKQARQNAINQLKNSGTEKA